MKIMSFIPADCNLAPLIDRGITEYYFGHIPAFWQRKYSMINSINRRYQLEGQMGSMRNLKKLLAKDHGVRIKFFLALNNHLYTQDQIDQILLYFKDLFLGGLEGVICADIGLMGALKSRFSSLKIHASLGTPCLNSEAVRFFKKLGVARIVLDRSVAVKEAAIIRTENPDIELEVFSDQTGCPHTEAVCTHHHGSNIVCLEKVCRFTDPPVEIKSLLMDRFSRLHSLFKIGIDYVKIPRPPNKGMTSGEMLREHEKIFSFIQGLNKYNRYG